MSLSLTYYGHSCIGIDADGTKLLIDPFLAPNSPVATVTAEDVEADYILISHGHGDHIADAVAVAKRTGALVIANFEIAEGWLPGQGVDNCRPMHIGGGRQFSFGHVKLTIAHHGSQLPDGSNGGNPAGFLITFNNGKRIYFAGDTGLTYDMKLIADWGGCDVALLPIGDNFTMGPEDAVTAAQFVNAKRVVPIHYNTWPSEIGQDVDAFASMLKSKAGIECAAMSVDDTIEI